MPSSSLRRGQSLGAAQTAQTDYELGKTYGQLDADQYYGGLRGEALTFLLSIHQSCKTLAGMACVSKLEEMSVGYE